MSQNRPSRGINKTELEKLRKKLKPITNFANFDYISMHGRVVREIQTQRELNVEIAQKSMHKKINSCFDDMSTLHPDLQDIIEQLREQANVMMQEHEELNITFESIDYLLNLAIPNISIEEIPERISDVQFNSNQVEPKTKKLTKNGENVQSRKPYNIIFNLKGAVTLLFDWILFGHIDSILSPKLIVMLIRSFGKLWDLSLIHFDYIHAIIIQEWYRMPKKDGAVVEYDLIKDIIDNFQEQIPDLNKDSITKAVNDLVNFRCASIDDGKLTIIESIDRNSYIGM